MSYSRMDRLGKELERAISEEDFELALESIEDMIELGPDNAQLFNSKGVVLAKMKRYDEAIEAFDTALRLDQGISRVWYSKGVVLMDSGGLRQALACFYKALDLEPTYEKARERFIHCLDEMALRAQVQTEPTIEGPYMPGPDGEKVIPPPSEDPDEGPVHEPPSISSRRSEERAAEVESPRARKRRGTYLDEEMFGKEEGVEEDWDDEGGDNGERKEDNYGTEAEEDEGKKGHDEDADWDAEGDFEDWGDQREASFIRCRCGADIKVETDERPYKFECKGCGRTGNLK
ncbi:MAG: tetratricopeptide repeat protein [Candidatus Thermoplasmatota archaeon]|jgi:tetratricopeptide (TPR) repeat protein|nr:tetratricopeptide repeat protein [Candidatus Thermoplasmatota archaeon]